MCTSTVMLKFFFALQGDTSACPNQVDCLSNPCENATCPRFLNALCIPDNCHGNCRAAFYRKRNLKKEITNKCNVLTCSDTKCPSKRSCIDEVVPIKCRNPRKCRQHQRPRCVLPPKSMPPSDCSLIVCPNGTVCNIRDTKKGRVAKCVTFRPRNCTELGLCDPGMVCHVKERDDKLPVAHCVPKHTSAKPRDCSQVECMKGFTCSVFKQKNRPRARCTKEKPRPKLCADLDCESSKMSCRQEGRGPVCFIARNCSELICTKKQSCHITLYSERNVTEARCLKRRKGVSPSSCDLLPHDFCNEYEVCIDVNQQNKAHRVAQCYRTECDLNQTVGSSCALPSNTCIATLDSIANHTSLRSLCVPSFIASSIEHGTNCSTGRQAPCPAKNKNGENITCQDFTFKEEVVGSVCGLLKDTPAVECSEVACGNGMECVQEVVPHSVRLGEYKRATCLSSVLVDQELERIGGGNN